MKIVDVNITDLIPANYNPRRLTDKQAEDIKASLTEFGFVDPIIVNKDNTIIGGHQRVNVWDKMGNKTVPVNYVDVTKEKERELNIRLNKNSGEWNWDTLANEFDIPDLISWGFEEEYLFGNIDHIEQEETEGDDDIPEQAPAITVKGDLYELGEHRVLCGDSTMIDEVEKLMSGKKADMVYTDPPYGVDYSREKFYGNLDGDGVGGKIKNDESEIEISILLSFFDCPVFIWGANNFVKQLPKNGRWYCWDKRTNGSDGVVGAGDGVIGSQFELMWTNKDSGYQKFYRIMHAGVKNADGENLKRVHPTQKPIKLAESVFEYENAEKLVVDLFLGSGTTLIACEKTKRKCYGMELDEKYCDVIVKRYVEFCKKNNKPYSVKRNGEECKDFE